MGRPTRSGSVLRGMELQHIEHILSISRNTTHAAFCLGVTLRSLHILFSRGEIAHRKPNTFKPHPLSRPELSLREFRGEVVRDAVRRNGCTVKAAKELGTSTKTIYCHLDPSLRTRKEKRDVRDEDLWTPKKSGRPRREIDPKRDLPESFMDRKPDREMKSTVTRDNLEVSVWVSPEERDEYYNYDYPWGTYHNHHGLKSRVYSKEKVQPCHALGYGEDE